ncbi:MAG: flagellar basal body rod protein FlgB [Firmicutes bacterium]|nr:flagellar basal body rod protein FlgB [Bacillota bacterium]
MNQLLTDKTNLVLQLALNAAAERQRVTAHNVANINTPGYKRQVVLFEEKLKQALQNLPQLPLTRTHERHMDGVPDFSGHQVITDESTSMRTDGNNVDIEREMVLLSMNQLNFNAVTQVLNNRYSILRHVIQEGRR